MESLRVAGGSEHQPRAIEIGHPIGPAVPGNEPSCGEVQNGGDRLLRDHADLSASVSKRPYMAACGYFRAEQGGPATGDRDSVRLGNG